MARRPSTTFRCRLDSGECVCPSGRRNPHCWRHECAAPLWAGFMALVNQQAATQGAPPVGFLNPTVYTLGLGSRYASSFTTRSLATILPAAVPQTFLRLPAMTSAPAGALPQDQFNQRSAVRKSEPAVHSRGTTVKRRKRQWSDRSERMQFSLCLDSEFRQRDCRRGECHHKHNHPGVTILQPTSPYPNLVPPPLRPTRFPSKSALRHPSRVVLPRSQPGGHLQRRLQQFNYTIPSSSVYAITQTNGASIVTGVTDTGNHCDDCCTTIGLPFAYPFYGQSYTNVTLSSNGNLQFAGSNATPRMSVYRPSELIKVFSAMAGLRTDGAGNGSSPRPRA